MRRTSIFISYAREDDEPFVQRLHVDLEKEGFNVWFDRDSMSSRSLTFHQEIRDSIRSCDRLVLVIGPSAAQSDNVTAEWNTAYAAEKPITPILRSGDDSLLPEPLKRLHYEDFRDDTRYAHSLRNLVRQLSEPPPPLAPTNAPRTPDPYIAQAKSLQELKEAVTADLRDPVVVSGLTARFGLYGMAGIGKSVMASALAWDRQIRQAFPDGIIWLSFGPQPDLKELQQRVVSAVGSQEILTSDAHGRVRLRELLLERAVLLILDDLWEARHVEVAFDVLGPGCRALLTTRDLGLLNALRCQSVPVELLPSNDALKLLALSADQPIGSLPPEAEAVAQECDRLPLALALCGGMARGDNGHPWSSILEALQQATLEYIGDDQIVDERHRSLFKAINISVRHLTPDDKERFAELSVFPPKEQIPEQAVFTLWSGPRLSGEPSIKNEKLLKGLWERSLINLERDGVKRIRRVSMHDLLYDFAQHMAGDRVKLHNRLLAAYRSRCPSGWATGPNDGFGVST